MIAKASECDCDGVGVGDSMKKGKILSTKIACVGFSDGEKLDIRVPKYGRIESQ